MVSSVALRVGELVAAVLLARIGLFAVMAAGVWWPGPNAASPTVACTLLRRSRPRCSQPIGGGSCGRR